MVTVFFDNGTVTNEQWEHMCTVTYVTQRWALEGVDHMPFSRVPPTIQLGCSAAFGCALNLNQEFIIQCFFFFFLIFRPRKGNTAPYRRYFARSFSFPRCLLRLMCSLLESKPLLIISTPFFIQGHWSFGKRLPQPCLLLLLTPFRGPLLTVWSGTSVCEAGRLRKYLPCLDFTDALFIWALNKGPPKRKEGNF